MNQPLISCICITRHRPQLLARAIQCFEAQTYPNKELVIVLEDGDIPTIQTVNNWNKHNDKPVKIITASADPENKLGNLRNLGIEQAGGQYFCQWDDDDWYHPERLTMQYEQLITGAHPYLAAVLDQWIIFDAVNRLSYLSCQRYWEGSILCDRAFALNYKYQNLDKGEDTPLIEALANEGKLQVISDHAYLYIYTFHGANTWDFRHFSGFIRYSQSLTDLQNKAILQLLENNNREHISLLEKIY
jgi:glycosyltransferase involved in cell wall biosynthesis